MKRRIQNSPQSMLRGNELMRLMSMIGMLGILFLLIVRAGDPNTWTWLANDAGLDNSLEATASIDNQNNTDNISDIDDKKTSNHNPADKPAESKESTPSHKSEELTPESGGPTDQDPEEFDALREDFQVITDGTISIPEMEMRAYHRLLSWVESQTLDEMRKRAKKDFLFTHFVQSPDKYRGQLFELKLTLHLVRNLDAKYNGKELYDVWGPTDESTVWLYNGVVIDLPKGMPVGREIYQHATLVGYFFKMQGYMEAGAKPRSKPLQAPLFVGRLIWHPVEKTQSPPKDWTWGYFILVGFMVLLIIRWGLWFWSDRNRMHSKSITPTPANTNCNPVDDWLENVDSHESADENKAED